MRNDSQHYLCRDGIHSLGKNTRFENCRQVANRYSNRATRKGQLKSFCLSKPILLVIHPLTDCYVIVQALDQLRFAQGHFDEEAFSSLALTGPRLRSPLERSNITFPIYPPLPVPRSFLVPQSTGAAVRDAIGSTLLRRSSTQRSATRTTLVHSQAEMYDPVAEEGDGVERPEEAGRGGDTWRDSVFGTVRIW